MKFIVGLASGIVLGAAGAVAYSLRTGQDLREVYKGVRSDIEKGDLDALGSRLESGFAELQAVVEERMNQVKASTAAAIDEANRTIVEARAQAAAAADQASSDAAAATDDIASSTGSAASDAADAAADAASDAGDAIEASLDDVTAAVEEHTGA